MTVSMASLADVGIQKWQKRFIKTKHKTTTRLGKREYMKIYMRLWRKEKKSPLLE